MEAQKKGLFEKIGLKPNFVKFVAGAPMMAAAQSKSIDVATVGMVPFLSGVGQGIPWVAIGFHVAGPRGEGIIARKGAGIRTLADLKGKRIGYFRASTAHYGLFMALQKNGIAPNQVTLLSMAGVVIAGAVALLVARRAHALSPYLGYGAAVQTGVKYGLQRGYPVVVTFDGDGQHDPRDIAALVEAVAEGATVPVLLPVGGSAPDLREARAAEGLPTGDLT